jgi:hypothetical protein
MLSIVNIKYYTCSVKKIVCDEKMNTFPEAGLIETLVFVVEDLVDGRRLLGCSISSPSSFSYTVFGGIDLPMYLSN